MLQVDCQALSRVPLYAASARAIDLLLLQILLLVSLSRFRERALIAWTVHEIAAPTPRLGGRGHRHDSNRHDYGNHRNRKQINPHVPDHAIDTPASLGCRVSNLRV